VTFLELWLGLASVANVSVQVVARTNKSKKISLFSVSRRVW